MLRKRIAIFCFVLALAGGGSTLVYAQVPMLIPMEPQSYRSVAKQVLPAVVSIETRGKTLAQEKIDVPRSPYFKNSQLPKEFGKLFEGMPNQPGKQWRFFDEFPNQLPRQPQHGFGSGFLIDSKGIIVTNNHVVRDADQVVVHLYDGRKFVSRDIKTDPKTDLAIVRIQTKDSLPALSWGNSTAMEIGDRVLAVGSPYGLKGSVSAGIVSGKGRNLGINAYEDFVQTDAAINPGNSGGPLVNLEGKVVGINTAIKTQSGGSQGIGLAIASNTAKNIVDQLIHQGSVHRGYVGMQIRTLAPEVAARLGIPTRAGVVVSEVMESAPAAKAGVKAGDVITALAGTPVREARDVQRFFLDQPAGKSVEVTLYRDGQEKKLPVTVAEQSQEHQPTAAPANSPRRENQAALRLEKIGITLGDMTPALAKQWSHKSKEGAIVTGVDAGGLAAEAGLQRGALLIKVDNKTVATAAEAKQALEGASLSRGILLQLRTPQNGVEYVMLEERMNK